MTDTLQAGPDLDARVAEAIGYELAKKAVRRVEAVYLLQDDGVTWKRFSPSTDMNDAMDAAGKFPALLKADQFANRWVATLYFVGERAVLEGGPVQGEGPTAQLAICAAILKVKA